jgi:Ca2+-binding RTX toxin-like protein
MGTRLLSALVTALAGLTVGPVVGPVSSMAAAPVCQGREATIVADPSQQYLTGTEGDDVIVSNYGIYVESLSGDDTICLTGGGAYAGAGDDSVIVSGTAGVNVVLGAGDDRFIGGPGPDRVDDGASLEGKERSGNDTIDTGAGSDTVRSGWRNEPNRDAIDLGPGNDTLSVTVRRNTAIRFTGGRGRDFIAISGRDANLGLDLAHGLMTRRGARIGSLTGFDRYSVHVWKPAAVTVLGSKRADWVDVAARAARVDLRGGNDLLGLSGPARGAVEVHASGGSGVDSIVSGGGESLLVDLPHGVVRLLSGSPDGVTTADVSGFEDVGAYSRQTTVIGDAGRNTIRTYGCPSRVQAGAGDDIVVFTSKGEESPQQDCFGEISGGPGDDLLVGSHVDDVLLGDRGRDEARGRGGSDRCVAELELTCER